MTPLTKPLRLRDIYNWRKISKLKLGGYMVAGLRETLGTASFKCVGSQKVSKNAAAVWIPILDHYLDPMFQLLKLHYKSRNRFYSCGTTSKMLNSCMIPSMPSGPLSQNTARDGGGCIL